jgi:hypothetical protein
MSANEKAMFDAYLQGSFGIGEDPAPSFFGVDPDGPIADRVPSPAERHEARAAEEARRRGAAPLTDGDDARIRAYAGARKPVSRLGGPTRREDMLDMLRAKGWRV